MNSTPFVRKCGILLTSGVIYMGKTRKYKKYTPEFKQMVVETMHKEGLSCSEAERRFEVRKNGVRAWEQVYLKEGPEGLYIERRGHGSKGRRPKEEKPNGQEDLLAEVERLRAENAYLKKLNALVAERVRQERKQK